MWCGGPGWCRQGAASSRLTYTPKRRGGTRSGHPRPSPTYAGAGAPRTPEGRIKQRKPWRKRLFPRNGGDASLTRGEVNRLRRGTKREDRVHSPLDSRLFRKPFLNISRQWAQTQRSQQLQCRLVVSPASVANAIECAPTVSTAASRASASSHTTSRSSGTAQGAGSARRPPRTGTLGCRASADCTTPALEDCRRARALVDSEAPGLRPTPSRRPGCVLRPQRRTIRKR